jgi:hypothetical protein
MSQSGRPTMLATAACVAMLAASSAAHVPLQPPGSTIVQLDLNVGGTSYSVRGPGDCNYAADASIYQAAAQMWSVRRHDADKDVNFTLWRLHQGSDMFTLFVTTNGKTEKVNTLQVGPPADRLGSGSVVLAQRGKGGLFTIDAVAGNGAKITGTLACSDFMSPVDQAAAPRSRPPDHTGQRQSSPAGSHVRTDSRDSRALERDPS